MWYTDKNWIKNRGYKLEATNVFDLAHIELVSTLTNWRFHLRIYFHLFTKHRATLETLPSWQLIKGYLLYLVCCVFSRAPLNYYFADLFFFILFTCVGPIDTWVYKSWFNELNLSSTRWYQHLFLSESMRFLIWDSK